MTSEPALGRMKAVLDALRLRQGETQVRQLTREFGGEPVEIREYRFGEPRVFSRHLRFSSGGEIVFHDDVVSAVILHVAPTPFSPRGVDVGRWITGIDNDATFARFREIFGSSWRFADGDRFFTLGSVHILPRFTPYASSRPGNLQRVLFTVDDPSANAQPEDEGCSVCRALIVRTDDGSFDVDGTVDALLSAVAAGSLKQQSGAVAITDLRRLHASGLMTLVESQVSCTACTRVACLTLYRDAAPTFGYYTYDAATRRPLEAVPPIERWGTQAQVAAARDAMRYVDHEPGSWFLVERTDGLYFMARYVISSMAEDSLLICLDESERQQYRERGRAYLNELARVANDSGAHLERSPFYARNLYRTPEGRQTYSDEVDAAVANYTWLSRTKQAAANRPTGHG